MHFFNNIFDSPETIIEGLNKAIALKESKNFISNIAKMNSTLHWKSESISLIKIYKKVSL